MFGWERETGSLLPGLQADLLVIDGNPLDDIRILGDARHIHAIYKGGELIDRPASPPTRKRLAHERGFNVSTSILHRGDGENAHQEAVR
jgi:hypothetical protein